MRQSKTAIVLLLIAGTSFSLSAMANPFAAPAPPTPQGQPSGGPGMSQRAEDAMFERFLDRLNRESASGGVRLGISGLSEGTVNPKEIVITPQDVLKKITYVGTFSGKHVYRSQDEGCYIHEVQINKDETKVVESRCLERTIERLRNSSNQPQ